MNHEQGNGWAWRILEGNMGCLDTQKYANLLDALLQIHFPLGHTSLSVTSRYLVYQGRGKYNIICIEELVHEVLTVGLHFKEANNFLWPFKLKAPLGGLKNKRNHYVQGR